MPGAHKKKTKGAKVKRKKADSARKELAAQRAAGGARVEDGTQVRKPPKTVGSEAAAKLRNPKAFVFSGRGKAKKQASRTAERDQRRMHVPVMEVEPQEDPPIVVLVHGPPGVGKSTLIQALVKHYTNQTLGDVRGPVTIVAGKKRRLTFVECPQDMHAMLDAAKYADLVLLLIDASFGFEMETFEFLNLLQVHGFPKVMGVLTHLDGFRNDDKLKKVKKSLKHRFWTEIYQGAKLFYLSGMRNGKYLKREVLNLGRFISVMKFRPLSWRTAHGYVVADRMEDLTPPERVEADAKCDRDVALYGYLRGAPLRPGATLHVAGAGDYAAADVGALGDPCPLPGSQKRRGLGDKDRLLYAPMAGVGGLLYDRDAVYIDIPDWKLQYSGAAGGGGEGETMVRELQDGSRAGVDQSLRDAKIQMFGGGAVLDGHGLNAANGRRSYVAQASDSGQETSESGSDASGSELDDSEDDSSASGSKDEGGAAPQQDLPPSAAVSTAADGRVRRRAVFHDATLEHPSASDSSSNDEVGPAEESHEVSDNDESKSGAESDSEEEEDDEGLGAASRWKAKLLDNAAAVFASRSVDLQAYVYGEVATTDPARRHARGAQSAAVDSDDDELFKVRGASASDAANSPAEGAKLDAADCSRPAAGGASANLTRWDSSGAAEQLRDRFVTGDWDAARKRAEAIPGDSSSSDDEFGEFEDIETGEKFGAGDDVTEAAKKAIRGAAKEEGSERQSEKAAKKAAFDSEYDVGGSKAVDDGSKATPKGGAAKEGEPSEEVDTFYDSIKADMAARTAKTRGAMAALDPVTRVAMEGHRPGAYLRIRLSGMPAEMVTHFDPRVPLLAGAVAAAEAGVGHMRLRLKRHRWFPKTLKNRDPLIFSIGWRRFQSVPVYATEDPNARLRALKYTPEHMHCNAIIWGALAPPGTGVIAVQKAGGAQAGWRVSASGVITSLEAAPAVVKKLKLVGHPFKIHKHTAFVGGMFNSSLEVAKFEGASVRTVSGIRGTIKKALREGVHAGKDGSFRATFEDKPLLSDTVFLRAWVAVDLPRLYNPVTNLLAPPPLPPAFTRNRKAQEVDDEMDPNRVPLGVRAPASLLALTAPLESAVAAAGAAPGFVAAASFAGALPGCVFRTGEHGTGYYPDLEQTAVTGDAAVAAAASAVGAIITDPSRGDSGAGWAPMRTVADLRRSLGVGAPRERDSLYAPIERAPRKFNPLKIPRKLQEALPFKSKPKVEAKTKRPGYLARRTVPLEHQEKKAMALYASLAAIRNDKAAKRRDQQTRRRAEKTKKVAAEEAWRESYNKEERKKRYVEKGQADARQAKKARGNDE